MPDAAEPEEACTHAWSCPTAFPIPGEAGVTIVLPLYCTRCAAVQTKIAPPPEQSRVARAHLLPAAPVGHPVAGRAPAGGR